MIAEELLAAAAALSSLLFGTQQTTYQIADKLDVSESTVHAAISRVLDFLDFISAREICWPYRDEKERNKRAFMKLVRRRSGLPDVVGAIDGCHVRIAGPTESEQSYYNRGYLVGDAAYPLKMWLLPSYRHTTAKWEPWMTAFNYANTRQRMVIEQAFGILKARFQRL
ncbi:hypothetical protein MTO96_052141 [Rhipicephalus appendiculatus]